MQIEKDTYATLAMRKPIYRSADDPESGELFDVDEVLDRLTEPQLRLALDYLREDLRGNAVFAASLEKAVERLAG